MYQKLTIIGHLGGDPEMRYTPNGDAVTNFSVATTRRSTNPQTEEVSEQTTWIRVSVWGRQAENCNQYLSKGRRVLVEGRLNPDDNGSPRIFTRSDGTVGASYEMRARNVVFLGGPRENGNGAMDEEVVEEGETVPF
jgi:single-strand DNA-binding protein